MLTIIAAQTPAPVSLDEVKRQCSATEFASDDDLLTLLTSAAVEYVQTHVERALSPKSFRLGLEAWPPARRGLWHHRSYWGAWDLEIPCCPVSDVTQISYFDEDDAEQIVAAEDWSWAPTTEGAAVRFVKTFTRPCLSSNVIDPVRVLFDAGYEDPTATGSGDDPALILPVRVKQTILLLVAHWYRQREAVVIENGSVTVAPMPAGFDALLAQLRVYR